MLSKRFCFFLIFLVDSCWSYGSNHVGVKGGTAQQGIKSYGGYFPESGLPNNFVHSPQYHQQQPQSNFYQPYGWNYNQPTRTYGGVMQPSYPHNQQGFGWFGGENQFANGYSNNNNENSPPPPPPKQPSLFLPNFVPPVYFNNPPYPSFPNFNFNQFPYAPPFNNNPNAGSHGNNQGSSNQFGGQHRPQSNGEGEFQGHNQNGGNQFVGQRPQQPEPGNQFGSQTPLQQGQGNQFAGQSPHYPSQGNQFAGQTPQQNNFGTQYPQQPQPVVPLNPQQSHNHQHSQNTGDDKFLTNAFFGSNQDGSEHGNRQWTEDDELKWQATTKAPYFENKVPGLECSLPASAVLGATTALKASSLLPLNVPIGKPILSCNATELLQAQINLNGIIYDCHRSAITMSCPRIDLNGLIQDECQGETLECDVRMRQNTRSVSCTNGTLISNHPIVCKSATLMEKKNVLNCVYKGSGLDWEIPTPSSPEQTTIRPHQTARPPVAVPGVSILPPLENENNNDVDDVHIRFNTDRKKLETLNLHQEVQKAMDSVFPHELLSVASRQMYLPPKFSDKGQVSKDLKDHLDGVFPHELLAILQTDEANSVEANEAYGQGLSLIIGENKNREDQASLSQQRQSQWDVNVNRKTGNPNSSIKTQFLPRFSGVTESYDEDRLIFSS